jgi:hypothetical protein
MDLGHPVNMAFVKKRRYACHYTLLKKGAG